MTGLNIRECSKCKVKLHLAFITYVQFCDDADGVPHGQWMCSECIEKDKQAKYYQSMNVDEDWGLIGD